ncbi:MAG: alpha/beta hydrolase [Alphaproteobacteria bacterium]|nr:alpha/beta hydrolase [Alphaproteobacteria bacterium]MDP6517802.1 alpha/beta hydrolase [Alphaproteobacteria bacterium]
MLYRDFADQDSIDAEYDPARGTSEVADIIARWQDDSARVRADLACELGVRFGPTKAEYMDIFPAARARAPVHLFIHGGYWRRFSAREFSFVARALVAAGTTVAISNYALCPDVTIDEIVRQTRAAIAWLYGNISDFRGDHGMITISGHSAGGHLVAMALATDWPGEYGLPADLVKGACAISGLYDLAPFPYSYLQPRLQLTWDQVGRNSPIRLIPEQGPALTVAVGGAETAEFQRQSRDYLAAWQANGLAGTSLVPDGANHFTMLDGFADPDSALGRAILTPPRPR